MTALILYSRSYCHLCDDMRDALLLHRQEFDFTLETVDVDADPALLALYDESVPVLAARMPDGSVQMLCRHFFDPAVVLAFLGGPVSPNQGVAKS